MTSEKWIDSEDGKKFLEELRKRKEREEASERLELHRAREA